MKEEQLDNGHGMQGELAIVISVSLIYNILNFRN